MARKKKWTRKQLIDIGVQILRETKKEYGAACLDRYELDRLGHGGIRNMLTGKGQDGRARYFTDFEKFRRACVKLYEMKNAYLDDPETMKIFRDGQNRASQYLVKESLKIKLPGFIAWQKKKLDDPREFSVEKKRSRREKIQVLEADLTEARRPITPGPPMKMSLVDMVWLETNRRKRKTYDGTVRTIFEILQNMEQIRVANGECPDFKKTTRENWYKKELLRKYMDTTFLIAQRVGGAQLMKYMFVGMGHLFYPERSKQKKLLKPDWSVLDEAEPE